MDQGFTHYNSIESDQIARSFDAAKEAADALTKCIDYLRPPSGTMDQKTADVVEAAQIARAAILSSVPACGGDIFRCQDVPERVAYRPLELPKPNRGHFTLRPGMTVQVKAKTDGTIEIVADVLEVEYPGADEVVLNVRERQPVLTDPGDFMARKTALIPPRDPKPGTLVPDGGLDFSAPDNRPAIGEAVEVVAVLPGGARRSYVGKVVGSGVNSEDGVYLLIDRTDFPQPNGSVPLTPISQIFQIDGWKRLADMDREELSQRGLDPNLSQRRADDDGTCICGEGPVVHECTPC